MKYCNFDCIFCPIGRKKNKFDTPQFFGDIEDSLKELVARIEDNNIDLVFINSKGEALVNNKINEIINLIKSKGLAVRLLSSGNIKGNLS